MFAIDPINPTIEAAHGAVPSQAAVEHASLTGHMEDRFIFIKKFTALQTSSYFWLTPLLKLVKKKLFKVNSAQDNSNSNRSCTSGKHLVTLPVELIPASITPRIVRIGSKLTELTTIA